MTILDERVQELADRLSSKEYAKKKEAIVRELQAFLKRCDGRLSFNCCNPKDILRFLVFKDDKGKTQVHGISCPFLGQSGIQSCGCPLRLASGTVSSIISQLKAFFYSLGFGHVWSVATQSGNPAAAPQLQEYLKSMKDEQAEGHIVSKQAKPLFLGKLVLLSRYWQNELQGYLSQKQRFIFLRDRAFFTLQFFAGDRAQDLSYLVGQEVKSLPDGSGILIRLTFGKQWKGDDHNEFVVLRCNDDVVCPIRALENYYAWCKVLGEDLAVGYVFRLFPKGKSVLRMTSDVAYKQLKTHLRAIAIDEGETPHGIRAGNSISLALGGVGSSSVMSHIGWKSESSFAHYTRQSLFHSVNAAKNLSLQAAMPNMEDSTSQAQYASLDSKTMHSFFR